jgi:hypothetical protein
VYLPYPCLTNNRGTQRLHPFIIVRIVQKVGISCLTSLLAFLNAIIPTIDTQILPNPTIILLSLENTHRTLRLYIPDSSRNLGVEEFKALTSTTRPTFANATPAVYAMAEYAKEINSQAAALMEGPQKATGDLKIWLSQIKIVIGNFLNELFAPKLPNKRVNKLKDAIQSGLGHGRLAKEASKERWPQYHPNVEALSKAIKE